MSKIPRTRVHHRLSLVALIALMALGAMGTDVASAQPVRRTRIRWGVEGGAGGDWGTPRGPSLGLFGQVGGQFNNRWALFYQPSLTVHAFGTRSDADRFAAFGNLAMADVTIGPLQLGLGGGFDIGHFAACTNNVCTGGARMIQPAVGGRIALVAPIRRHHGRLGIPFAFQVHSTFLDNNQHLTALLLTIGIQRF